MERAQNHCLVGVISDTHGLLDPRVLTVFEGVSHIIHAGDIGGTHILRGLEAVAPVTAVRGNTDIDPWAWDIPGEAVLELGGRRLLVAHIKDDALRGRDPVREGLSVVVTGHSHKPALARDRGVLYLNPGSAGKRRFALPRAVALLTIPSGTVAGDPPDGADAPQAEIVILEEGGGPRS